MTNKDHRAPADRIQLPNDTLVLDALFCAEVQITGLDTVTVDTWLIRGILETTKVDGRVLRGRRLFSVLTIFEAKVTADLVNELAMGPSEASNVARCAGADWHAPDDWKRKVVEAIERSANVARVFLLVARADEGWITIPSYANKNGPPARRQELAVRREQERKQREQKRDQERSDKRAEHKRKEKEKAFESLISLPSEQQETRLGELARRLDEDVAVIRDDFTAFVGMESRAASTNSWNVELWPDPVETQALLRTCDWPDEEVEGRTNYAERADLSPSVRMLDINKEPRRPVVSGGGAGAQALCTRRPLLVI